MAITHQQFDDLITRLETVERNKPRLYKLTVGLLALLGYTYIFFLLALLIAALTFLVLGVIHTKRIHSGMIQLIVLLLVPAWIILQSLWVTLPPPQGLKITRNQCPHLFSLIDELKSALKAPRFHHVLLTDEFNCGVVQRPRLGILGWQENYLILGLPLMLAFSPAQFRAVLAHEFGHLSGNHARFGGWIYRLQKTYTQIFDKFKQSEHQGADIIFNRFFNWYAPFFAAYSFVLRRSNEYEADLCAVKLAGLHNNAEALLTVNLKSRFLNACFWPKIYKKVYEQVEPPATVYSQMAAALSTPLNPAQSTGWLAEAFTKKTDNSDTHPCLTDRLSHIGYLDPSEINKISVPPALEKSAAEEFLGNVYPTLVEHFNNAWKQTQETPWRQRYAYIQDSLKQLENLEFQASIHQLTSAEIWNLARLTAEFKSHDLAIPLFQQLLAIDPNHSEGNYYLGCILLEKNDGEAIAYLEKAMAVNPDMILEICKLIYQVLIEKGEIEKAKIYESRYTERYNLLLKAQEERSFVTINDEFEPHNLPEDVVSNFCEQLAKYSQIKEALLTRKKVTYLPENPYYILSLTLRRIWYKYTISDEDELFLHKLVSELQFPELFHILIANDMRDQTRINHSIAKKQRKIEGALIYTRPKHNR